MGESWVSAYTALGLGQLGLAQGAGARAVAQLEEAIRLAGASGDLQAVRWAQTALAEGELLAGKAQDARKRLEPLLDRPGQQEVLVTYLMPYLAWAYLEISDEERAAALLGDAIARSTGENIRLALVDALRVRALLALRRGQHAAAAEDVERGLALAAEMGYPHGRAKLLYTWGLVATEQGEPARARERFTEALGILRPLGERLYAGRCEGPQGRAGLSR
jgi:tetratricopeptide (TPR) repeat protein